jgi:predicted naringenin-chalcone synthase
MDQVHGQYEPLLDLYPEDADYQQQFVHQVRTAARMAGALSIDAHPLHLPLPEIVRPRGWGIRNAQALEAFSSYAPLAAKRALRAVGLSPDDVDAVLVQTSTVVAMPALSYLLIDQLGLRSNTDVLPVSFMGCNGGAHAILAARDYVLAHPDRTVLMVAADYASPHFHLEPELRGSALLGSVISAALFADATAAAVMSSAVRGPGYRIVHTDSYRVPDTPDAVAWEVADDGLRFRLGGTATKLIPSVVPFLRDMLSELGWSPDQLAICSFHSGGDRIIDNVRDALGLSEHHVQPTRIGLRTGNTMSVAALDTLRIIATTPDLRPGHGARGIGAGFGPGFGCIAFGWTFHDPTGG